MPGLRALAAALREGRVTAVELVEQASERAAVASNVFIAVNPGLASLAQGIDRARRDTQPLPPLAGIPIALKDLFDVRNEVTLAGSRVLAHEARPATADAAVVAPLREAGLLFLGRTNMTEFAFSGLGRNPHYGTPLSIWDRATGRLPGGSSSGSGVAVGEGIVAAALGSDTAGSCRIPAAFNGVVGVKPSHGRLSLTGIYPLSPTLDAPGPLAVDVDSCFLLDQLMSGDTAAAGELPRLEAAKLAECRFAVPQARVMEDLDDEVKIAFESALDRLAAAGARITEQPMTVLDDCDDLFVKQPLVIYEVWQHHAELLRRYGDEYDPFVGRRMSTGAGIDAAEQGRRIDARNRVVNEFRRRFEALEVDALLYPTVACVPPALAETDDDEDARRINLRCLRNTATVNYFDGCAISLPCHQPGSAPVGLMLSSVNGGDEALYRVAAAVEAALSR